MAVTTQIASPQDLASLRERIIERRRGNKASISICVGTGCRAQGSIELSQEFRHKLAAAGIDDVEVRATGCHGFCEQGPLVVIFPRKIFYKGVTADDVDAIIDKTVRNGEVVQSLLFADPASGRRCELEDEVPFYAKQQRIVLRNNGKIDPTEIDDYIAANGYAALGKALTQMTPEQVCAEVIESGLRGRGGGGFPTGRKWDICRKQPGDVKHIICNGDEGDPGAFMDRSIMEGNPHSVLEGMAIGAYAIGARQAIIYVRAEYPLAVANLTVAIEQARSLGLLGEGVFGTDFNVDVDIVCGAGAFVCGEETALIASIEGKRGMPQPRPPFPAQKGLFGKPTNINNVETWANVPVIIERGAAWFASIGTERSKGTKVFSLVGKVRNTGLVEVPMGVTLREIVFDIGGGILGNKKFKAVQTGGPSGGCIPAEFLDLPIDYDNLAQIGSIMGSGGMVVMDEDNCMVDIARYFLEFTQKESCGKCVPCRLGIKQMLDILEDITRGRGSPADIDLLLRLAEGIRKGSLCGLGKTAPNPVLTTIRYFRDEYEAHVRKKKCPAVVCREIISSPCQHACPIDTQASVYVSLIAQRRFQEAWDVIRQDNPLPSICARVCHHPCEAKCQAGKWGDPIGVRALKRFVTDRARQNGGYPSAKKPEPRPERVGIVGAGPAGLSAAYYLALKGYGVTVFEAAEVPGGCLMLYIPEYRLPRHTLFFDIEHIRNAGVEIRTSTRVGEDVSFEQLLKEYKAVFVATGTHLSRKLGVPNEDATGVLDALEFLKDVNLKKGLHLGKRIGVVGGGNTAIDAARVAKRIKTSESVSIIYRRTRVEMPAFEEEINDAVEEGIEMQFLTAPSKVMVDENGMVTGLECIRMELGESDESGRRRPVPVKGSEFVIPLDTLMVAIGEEPDLSFLGRDHGIKVSNRNLILADPETYATHIEGVFAGGDIVTGPNTVIEAIAGGKVVAEMIDKYIQGKTLERKYKVTRPSMYVPLVDLAEEELEEARRPARKCPPVHERMGGFCEVELPLTEEIAVQEAKRCLRCEMETEDAKNCLQHGSQRGAQ